MKKFLLTIVLFTSFTVIFYVTTLTLWGYTIPPKFSRIGTYTHLQYTLSEVKKHNDIDILIIGSSHAYRGFDTRIFSNFGISAFNLGSSSQTPIQANILLNRYLENINPRMVLFEVYPETFMSDGVESSLDILVNDKNDFLSLEMSLKINNMKTYNTLLYTLFRDMLGLNRSSSESYLDVNDTYVTGGYVERKLDYFKPTVFEKKEISIKESQIESFSQIVSKLKAKNIDVILIYAPIPPSNYASYSNNSYFDSIMKSYSDYLNFNEIITLNDSLHFYDSNHLNQNGVELFNYKLINILNELHLWN